MRIRLFDRTDVPKILAIQDKAVEAARLTAADYQRLAENPRALILVAELDTTDPPKMLGFGAFHRIVDEAELYNLVVDPDHRQRGVGRALLEDARRRLMEAGAKRVFLEVRVSNKAAISLYSSVGFGIHSRRENYYRDPPEDAYVLCLELNPPNLLGAR
jgi:ribosomal-protein-alanine N-acetyltransferase